jgi:hypothetical protein
MTVARKTWLVVSAATRAAYREEVRMNTYNRTLGGVVAALAGVLLLPGSSRVSAQEPELRVQVPFEFTVGQTTLPRGTYEVSRANALRDVVVLSRARHQALVLAERDTRDNGPELTPSLVFDHQGSQYFLREVRFAENVDMRLPVTRAEREAAEQHASAAQPTVVVTAELR